MEQDTKRKIYLSLGFVILLLIILVLFYKLKFNGTFSNDSSDWANFTTFVFGIITPVISLLGFYFVILTIKNNDKHNLIIHYSNTLDKIDIQIEKILDKIIYVQFNKTNTVMQKTLRSALCYSANVKNDIKVISDSEEMNQINTQAGEVKKIRYYLIELSKIINEINRIDSNNKEWIKIYKIKYQEIYSFITDKEKYYYAEMVFELANKELSKFKLSVDDEKLFSYFK